MFQSLYTCFSFPFYTQRAEHTIGNYSEQVIENSLKRDVIILSSIWFNKPVCLLFSLLLSPLSLPPLPLPFHPLSLLYFISLFLRWGLSQLLSVSRSFCLVWHCKINKHCFLAVLHTLALWLEKCWAWKDSSILRRNRGCKPARC